MKSLRLFILLLIVTLSLAACGGAAPSEAAKDAPAAETGPTRTKLIIADQSVPEILDGQQSTYGYPLSHELIGQPVLRYDVSASAFVPDLIESFSVNEDGTVMTVKLPEGYTYSNGDPLDAQALADTINRYATISPYSFDYDGLEAVNVIDPTTLEIVNANGFNVMYPTLISSFGAAWDVAAAEEMGDEAFASNPVGSGPFMLKTEWAPGQDLELVRNDKYRTNMPMVENKGPVHLDEVLVRFIEDAQTRANELEAGSVDIVYGLSALAAASMQDNPDFQIFKIINPGQNNITMNTSRAPFDDLKVRQAVAMAVNREQIEVALNGAATAEYAFVAPTMLNYDPAAQEYSKTKYPFDLEAAKALLVEAGWEDSDGDGIVEKDGQPFTVEMLVSSDSAIQTNAAPVVQAQLKALGIDVKVAMQTNSYVRETMLSGDYDMSFSDYIWVDPDILTYRYTEGFSRSQFAPPELAEMLEKARYIPDNAERTAAYLDIQKYLLDNVPSIPLMNENLYIGARSWVKDIVIVNPYAVLLNDVTIVEE